MKERSIIFSGEMVNAILAGRKTMTRRVMRFQPPSDKHVLGRVVDSTSSDRRKQVDKLHWLIYENYSVTDSDDNYFLCPYGQVGDRLWVRESFRETGSAQKTDGKLPWRGSPDICVYRADGEFDGPWRPSIFMPRWASRVTLEITNVRVERLQDISGADCDAEGIVPNNTPNWSQDLVGGVQTEIRVIREAFTGAWNKINGKKHPWDSNPFVWVIGFRRIDA